MSGFKLNGNSLKRYRTRAMLTQEQLASLVDCSDRLIRKAEASGSLRYETIELIANVLTEQGQPASVEDLIGGNLWLAQAFMGALDLQDRHMLQHFDRLSEDFQMIVPGMPEFVPFAGHWHGIDGFRQYLNLFFDTFDRDQSVERAYLECSQGICVRFTDYWYCGGRGLPVWVNLHFAFSDGMITRLEQHYDTLLVHQALSGGSKQRR